MRQRLVTQATGVSPNEGVFHAPGHVSGARDPNVKVIVVGKRAVRLLHHFRGSHAQGQRGSDSLGVSEQPGAQRRGDENVSHVGRLVSYQGSHERPVFRIIEVRPRPADRRPVSTELNEVGRKKLTAIRSVNEETDIGVAPAFVRAVSLDSAAALAREMAHRGDGFRELPTNRARGAIDHRHEWLEAPAYVALRVGRDDPQVGGFFEVHPSGEVSLRGRAKTPTKPEGRSTQGCLRRGRMPWRDSR